MSPRFFYLFALTFILCASLYTPLIRRFCSAKKIEKISPVRLWLCSLCILLLFLSNVSSQTPAPQPQSQLNQEKKTETESGTLLQGQTEAILINGQPALRILSRNNMPVEITSEKRDNVDTLAVQIIHPHTLLACFGKLYISRERVTYVPDTNKSDYFNAMRSEIKDVKAGDKFRIGRALRFKALGDSKTFMLIGDAGRQALNFLKVAITDFDTVYNEFQRLTASVRPEPEEKSEEEEEETNADVTDKYDRFKDITVVRTSRMLLRSGRRSIRTYAEYSFAGKTPIKPEKVSLYFYASAARPVFREDDLELNFLVDGERIAAGNMRLSDEEKTKSAVRQTVVVTLPYETFARIANGKKAELQIGTLEYKMTDTHLDAFRRLLARPTQN